MSFLTDVKNAFSIITFGDWRELLLRCKVYLRIIDLKVDNPDAVPTERTYPYSNSGGINLYKVLDTLNISASDGIVDFGSGKGGALISFSRYPFRKITGVEISPDLAKIAEKNLFKLKIKDINIVVCDATDFTDITDYNYFYFANPFPANILRVVINNIESSIIKKPRKVNIIYFNPIFSEEIVTNTSFYKIKDFNHCALGFSLYSNERR